MFERQLRSILAEEIQHSPAIALLGPRQVGKTTLALEVAKGLLKNKLRKLLGVDAVIPLAVKLIAFNLDRCQICIRNSKALGVLGIVDFRSNC